ncbi:MAG: hypothetical protein NW241_03070 [Bacteroidia bacterium]|nr:hypothetical protein [Bacteroidia bacterium]
MLHLTIRTPVQGDYRSVLARFDRNLFERLAPPGLRVDIIRFDGSRPGDQVHIRLVFPLGFRQDWISEITGAGDDGREAWFTDEGRQLPFFLGGWHHRHVVRSTGSGSEIIDEIAFKGPFPGAGLLLWPVLYLQFAARRPVYQAVFGAPPA